MFILYFDYCFFTGVYSVSLQVPKNTLKNKLFETLNEEFKFITRLSDVACFQEIVQVAWDSRELGRFAFYERSFCFYHAEHFSTRL